MKRFFLLLLSLLFAHCASHTQLPATVRDGISARHIGRPVELKQSCYYGELYDENEKWLLSPYAFADTFHIVDTKGTPIHPRGQKGILPAGSSFIVQRVEFPDVSAMASRMLTTPRYNTWVYLSAPPGDTTLPSGRKYFILVLPMDLQKEDAIEAEINRLLSPAGETQKWLEGRSPTVRAAIAHKSVVEGMTLEELTASAGIPQRLFNEAADPAPVRIAWFGNTAQEAWLSDNNVVTAVKPARQVEEKPLPVAKE